METLWKDLRYGARMLARSPGFTAAAILSLALGIGANATIFSLVNALIFRPLPVANPSELAALYTSDFSGPLYGTSSYPDYEAFRAETQAFSGLAAYTLTPVALGEADETERVIAELVTGNYFSVLGVRPALGRAFRPEEGEASGADAVAVVGDGLFRRRFASDPGIVGRTIVLNGRSFTIVGVAPKSFPGMIRGLRVDLWIPIVAREKIEPRDRTLTARGNRGLLVIGRLRDGVTLEQAQAHVSVVAGELHRLYPSEWANVRNEPRVVTLLPEKSARILPQAFAPVSLFLALLMTVVALVLLIACANVAGMLLARATGRLKEMAIRLSLGAGRRRLARQLLTESLLLSLAAGAAGVLLAIWGTGLLMRFQPPLPVSIALDLGLDGRVLAFTLGVSLLTGVLFGLAPAMEISRPELVPALKDGGTGERKRSWRSVFIVAQVALSLFLLIGSGLFIRSLQNALAVDLGFDPRNLALLSMDLSIAGYTETDAAFYRQLLERVRSVPDVEIATLTAELPLGLGGSRRGISVEGYTPRPGEDLEVHSTMVGPDYFRTMRIPIARGREFDGRDGEGAPRVVMVNEAFVRRYWPGDVGLGKHLDRGVGGNLEVVGIAKDSKYASLGEEPRPFFYLPLLQNYEGGATLVARTRTEPEQLIPRLAQEIRALDKALPVFEAKTMTRHLSLALLPARLAGTLLGMFGLVALILAAVGIYGTVAYIVARRTREIGIRMALGADRRQVLRLVVGRGMRLALAGTAVGLVAAFGLTRFISSLLYGVSATDPITFGGITLLLSGVAFLASYLPARRAASVDPIAALRYE